MASNLNLKMGQNLLAMPINDLGGGWAYEYNLTHYTGYQPPAVYGGTTFANALSSQGFDHVRLNMATTLMWADPSNPYFLPESDTYAGSPITKLFNEIQYWLDAGFSVVLDPHVENVTVLDWGRPNAWGLVGDNPLLNGSGTLPVGYQTADTGVRAAIMARNGSASTQGRTRDGYAIFLRELIRKIGLRFAGKSIAISGFNEPYVGSLFTNPYSSVATSGATIAEFPSVLFTTTAVRVATTAALSAVTYNSGAGTLTSNAVGVLTIDGVSPSINDRILVKDQVSKFQNGIYTLTTVGTVGVPFVLTRATDADAANTEMRYGLAANVTAGSTNTGKNFFMNLSGTINFASSLINFVQYFETSNTYNLNFPDIGANLWMAWQTAYMKEFYNKIWLPETLEIMEKARFTLVIDVYCPWGFFATQRLFDPRGAGFNGSVISEFHMYEPFALTHQNSTVSVTYSPKLGWPYATHDDMLNAACVGTGGTFTPGSLGVDGTCSTGTASYQNAANGTFGRNWNPTGISALLDNVKTGAGDYPLWFGEMGLENQLNDTAKLDWMDDVADWCVTNSVGRCHWGKSDTITEFGILKINGQIHPAFATHASILPSTGTYTAF